MKVRDLIICLLAFWNKILAYFCYFFILYRCNFVKSVSYMRMTHTILFNDQLCSHWQFTLECDALFQNKINDNYLNQEYSVLGNSSTADRKTAASVVWQLSVFIVRKNPAVEMCFSQYFRYLNICLGETRMKLGHPAREIKRRHDSNSLPIKNL